MFARFSWLFSLFALACLAAGGFVQAQDRAPDSSVASEIKVAEDAFAAAFNAGKVAELAAHFSPSAEFIDENGNLYRGTAEITELFTQFFKRFPKAQLEMGIESVRSIGPNLAMEEGTRQIVAGADEGRAVLRFSAVRTKVAGKWLFASVREFTADPYPTPHERLESLSWLVGEWVNEGSDGVVKLNFHWSEDKNYLLAEYVVTIDGRTVMNSTQRIAWDPIQGSIRSWLFDSDGGFSEGNWTAVDDGWVVKSATTNPDATSGTATLTLQPDGKSKFLMKGSDRIVAGQRAPNFEFVIVRRPPAAGK